MPNINEKRDRSSIEPDGSDVESDGNRRAAKASKAAAAEATSEAAKTNIANTEEELLGDDDYIIDEDEEDSYYGEDEEEDDDYDDDKDDTDGEVEITRTGKSVVQTMLSLGCFEPLPVIFSRQARTLPETPPIGGGGVPEEEIQNMAKYAKESWLRMNQTERKMAKFGGSNVRYVVSDKDQPDRVTGIAQTQEALCAMLHISVEDLIESDITVKGTVVKSAFVKSFEGSEEEWAELEAGASTNKREAM